MKKGKIFMALMLITALFMGNVAYGEEYTPVNLLINGEMVSTDQPAVIYNSRTVVPIRIIAETFECSVDWDNATKTVIISQQGAKLYLTVGSNVVTAEMNGESASVEIDTTPIVINNRTMVPIAFISDVFGYNADWDPQTKTVSIYESESESTFTGSEYVDAYFEASERYSSTAQRVNSAILSLSVDEQLAYLDKYQEIDNKFSEYTLNKDIDTYTAEDVEYISSLADDMASLAFEIGGGADTGISSESSPEADKPVYYVNITPYNTTGGYSSIANESYSRNAQGTVGIDDEIAINMFNTFNVFKNKLSENTGAMNEDSKVMLDDLITRGEAQIKNMEDNPEDTFTYATFINGINAELGAMAEGLNIDIGEDLKDYNVSETKDVYSSTDLAEVRDAYYASLEKHNDYDSVISGYYNDFTSQQYDEYTRIAGAKMYYDFNQGEKDTIDYYRGALILLDRANARTEIFADKYGIEL